jgi:hypothetical protein
MTESVSDTSKLKKEEKGPYFTALNIIVGSISDECLHLVRNQDQDPATLWQALKSYYNPTSRTNRVRLRAAFYQITLADSNGELSKFIENINHQAAVVNDIIDTLNKMSSSSSHSTTLPPPISDEEKLCVVLSGLKDQYDTIQTLIDTDDTIDFHRACKMLIDQERKLVSRDEDARRVEEANRVDDARRNTYNKGNTNNVKRSRPFCKHCNKPGHWESTCWDLHPELQQKANLADGDDYSDPDSPPSKRLRMEEHEMVFSAADTKSTDIQDEATDKKHFLVLDSGCTTHLVGKSFLQYLSDLHKCPPRTIRLADKSEYKTTMRGTLQIMVQSSNGPVNLKLLNVLYIANISEGLISIPAMCDAGGKVTFAKDGCVLQLKSITHTLPRKNERLYKAFITHYSPSDFIGLAEHTPKAEVERLIQRTHINLGHADKKPIWNAIRKKKINAPGLTNSLIKKVIKKCLVCQMSKAYAKPVPKTASQKATKVGQRTHGDYSGKHKRTVHGENGFSLYIDEFSRWLDIKLVKHRDEVQEHFKQYVSNLATIFDVQVKGLRTDSAREYIEDREFAKWIFDEGIHQQSSCPYAQFQNGFAERTMRTIVGMTASMLLQSSVHIRYWGYALKCAVYIWNRLPTGTNKGITPLERMAGVVPDYSFLHPFGCEVIVRTDNDLQMKFHNKGNRHIFLGYDLRSKGYLTLSIDSGKIFVRAHRDCEFNDETFPLRSKRIRDLIYEEPIMHQDLFESPKPTPHSIPEVPIDLREEEDLSDPDEAEIVEEWLSLRDQEGVTSLDPSSDQEGGATLVPLPVQEGENPMYEPEVDPVVTQLGAMVRTLRPSVFLKETRDMVQESNARVLRSGNRYMVRETEEVNLCIEIEAATDVILFVQNLQTPKSFQQAMHLPEALKWREACDLEIAAIKAMKTYLLVHRKQVPSNKTIKRPVWAFKLKHDGRFKARLCFPGNHQKFGEDYTETYSPVLKISSMRLLLAFVRKLGGVTAHLDAPNAFLNGDMEEDEVYMEQPEGYNDPEFPNHVCRLLKALYGLKQAPLRWNSKLNLSLVNDLKLTRHSHDPCVYYRFNQDGTWIITLVYVDDIILGGTTDEVNRAITVLKDSYKCVNLGPISRYIGISIVDQKDGYFLNQSDEIERMLRKFDMWDVKSTTTPFDTNLDHSNVKDAPPFDSTKYRSAIGSLLWFAVCTRPDIMFMVNALAQFQSAPTTRAYTAVKHIFRYLRGTLHLGILIKGDDSPLTAYTDSSHGDKLLGRKSATGALYMFAGSPVHWICRKQRHVTISSTEAELVSLSAGCMDLRWLQHMMKPLVFPDQVVTKNSTTGLKTTVYVDNRSCKCIAENSSISNRTKHIDIRHFYVRELYAQKLISIVWIPSTDNLADIFTKAITSTSLFLKLRGQIMFSPLD